MTSRLLNYSGRLVVVMQRERWYMSNSLAEPGTSCLTCRVWSWGWICLASVWGCISRIDGSSRSVHVGFFLELTNVFLVSDSFIPKPVGNLSRQDKRKQGGPLKICTQGIFQGSGVVFSLHGPDGDGGAREGGWDWSGCCIDWCCESTLVPKWNDCQ